MTGHLVSHMTGHVTVCLIKTRAVLFYGTKTGVRGPPFITPLLLPWVCLCTALLSVGPRFSPHSPRIRSIQLSDKGQGLLNYRESTFSLSQMAYSTQNTWPIRLAQYQSYSRASMVTNGDDLAQFFTYSSTFSQTIELPRWCHNIHLWMHGGCMEVLEPRLGQAF